MVTRSEKMLFFILGTLVALIFAIGIYSESIIRSDRNPASEKELIPESLYFYYFD
jgi:hypothetical protein